MTSTKGNKPNNNDNELIRYFKERGIVFACIVIDCFFIAIWVLAVWVTDKYVITPLALKGVDKLALDIFQWVSGIATLLTLLAYTVKDLYVVFVKIRDEINDNGKRIP
ncbi:hypothetical protein [Anabaena sp. CCY 9910]|uniref:hypothetical protein n=1 Tax=Anabaena sp. CCY 9910 TaxID=3103870 RepID=UPI0039E14365